MPYVLSLIATPLHPIVNAGLVSEAMAVAPVFDLPVWLAEDIAAEIPFPASPAEAVEIEAAVRAVMVAVSFAVRAMVPAAEVAVTVLLVV